MMGFKKKKRRPPNIHGANRIIVIGMLTMVAICVILFILDSLNLIPTDPNAFPSRDPRRETVQPPHE